MEIREVPEFQIKLGKVNFNNMTLTLQEFNSDGSISVRPIRRTQSNRRRRIDAAARHEHEPRVLEPVDVLGIVNRRDLEWLSWNWLLLASCEKYKSRRDMVFGFFNDGIVYLPTPK